MSSLDYFSKGFFDLDEDLYKNKKNINEIHVAGKLTGKPILTKNEKGHLVSYVDILVENKRCGTIVLKAEVSQVLHYEMIKDGEMVIKGFMKKDKNNEMRIKMMGGSIACR